MIRFLIVMTVFHIFPTTSSAMTRCERGITRAVGAKSTTLLPRIRRYYVKSHTNWNSVLLALIAHESAFQSRALSSAGARGLMQITPLALLDARRMCPDLPSNSWNRMYEVDLNLRAGICYLAWIREKLGTGGSVFELLIAYNGGNRQLNRWRRGKILAGETANYVIRILFLIQDNC